MELTATERARENIARLFPAGCDELNALAQTDPEFYARFVNFAFDEAPATGAPADEEPLPERTRYLANLAALLGCQGIEAFRLLLPAALEAGVEPVAVKEVVYQATAYLGFGRIYPFLAATNDVFRARGIALPLPAQDTVGVDPEARAAAGEAKQVAYFGEQNRGFASSGNPAYPQINRWLSANCFGDWYTRGGLTDQERELVTFCFTYAQGGCEPQATAHARANMNIGNSKAFLLKIVSANVPYLGYPRTLNGITCIENASTASA